MTEQKQLLHLWSNLPEFEHLKNALEENEGSCAVFGIGDAPAIHMVASLAEQTEGPLFLVVPSEQDAMKTMEELSFLLSDVIHYPAREMIFQTYYASSRTILDQRLRALHGLDSCKICVMSIDAVMQKVVPKSVYQDWTLAVDDVLNLPSFADKMIQLGYERVDQISGAGQFSIRGAIIDVFVSGNPDPFRIELFDDKVDSIRSFDISTQRSLDKIEKIVILSATEVPIFDTKRAEEMLASYDNVDLNEKQRHRVDALQNNLKSGVVIEDRQQLVPLFYELVSIVSYLPKNGLIALLEPNQIMERAKQKQKLFVEEFAQACESTDALPIQGEMQFDALSAMEELQTVRSVSISALTRTLPQWQPKKIFQITAQQVMQYSASLSMLAEDLKQMKKNRAIVLFAGRHAEQLQQDLQQYGVEASLLSIMKQKPQNGQVLIVAQSIGHGYESRDLGVIIFSEFDIYGHKKRKTTIARKKTINKMDLFAELKIGDYVVHERYGIGIFQGIETHQSGSIRRDFLIIEYQGSDRVGVSTDDLDRVQKYVGASERVPRISKLGGADWSKTVSKARNSVKELAFDLVKLYAKRQEKKGFAFSNDTIWQKELEDSFPFEETPGQLRSIEEIKQDMESERTMDRLLCGDVGYGKTEVALRAAFKAVQDSKQVVFLAPTTILAQQHYLTLTRRLSEFPIQIDSISRLRTNKQQREILTRLKNGETDILVGTHRLLGKDVEFHDLGLLIVDEEQRFGVAHKEQIKNMKTNVDVLTLSATPIPRTLYMSMLGIRDMSIIDTPPEERFPITTYVIEFDMGLLAEAVRKEMAHDGQTYILYNQVSSMESFLSECQKAVPEANFAMAHGQMRQGELERIMLEFMNHEHDVLICSTIIESGVDIANANTLVVYDADRFGLAQLYQLRGRVGRSNRLAYAYLTFQRDKVLTSVAEKRLRAIRNFTEFGSGFKIAMQDLEIRGAGNLIGAEQHGHLNEIGYEYYCKLIEEAVEEVREETPILRVETQMDLSINAFIPHEYITEEARRLEMYKRIASIDSQEALYDVQEELEDRFGTIPESVQQLLDIALLKYRANVAQIEQITIRANEAKVSFHPEAQIDTNDVFRLIKDDARWSFVPRAKSIQIRYRADNQSPNDIFACLNGLVSEIYDCIRVRD